MIIKKIKSKPLLVTNKKPYFWSAGITLGAEVILVELETSDGIIGYGESISTPDSYAVKALIDKASEYLIDEKVCDIQRLMKKCYFNMFQAQALCSAPRFGAQILTGLELAMWDALGKTLDIPVHEILGGSLRHSIDYFGFIQGETPEELANHAKIFASEGHKVIYGKVGRGEQIDKEIVKQVRNAVGPEIRLRFDPNEAWDPITANRMIGKLNQYDVEMIEQPCGHQNLKTLQQIRQLSPISIAADQSVFNSVDVLNAVTLGAADLIVLGIHETGGILGFLKAAAVAEAAGINICIHGLHETGITTCASNQAGALVTNLDDGNQYMNHLLTSDIISAPNLKLDGGSLNVIKGPGLGFELDEDAVKKAENNYLEKIKNL